MSTNDDDRSNPRYLGDKMDQWPEMITNNDLLYARRGGQTVQLCGRVDDYYRKPSARNTVASGHPAT